MYESYRAGQASESILSELEAVIEDGSQDAVSDGSEPGTETSVEGGEDGNTSDSASGGSSAGGTSGGASSDGTGASSGGISSDGTGSVSGNGTSGNIYGDGQDDVNMGELYPDRDMPSVSVQGTTYIGYIFIPSLSIRLPIQGEWVYENLDISPARYSGSVYQNNMIIGGHSYISHFRPLRWIDPGAKVIFYDAEGYVYEYEVSYSMSLNPNQGAILLDEESEDWDLTLFTCNTGGQTRCIVRCVRTDQ